MAAMAVITLAAITACGGATTHRSAPSPTAPRPAPPTAAVPTLGCHQEATDYTGPSARARPGDLVIGPVSFPRGERLGHANPAQWGRRGDYKLPPVILPGTSVTISIAPPAGSHVVFTSPQLPARGAVSVRYRACAHARGFFPQSFRFTDGRARGCVPLVVRVAGEPRPRRATLSLFAGRCTRP
jgi:hypothetical protein